MLLMLDNYDSFTYNIVQYFGELGQDVRTYRNDEITIEEIEKLNPERICLSPGPCTPTEAGILVPARGDLPTRRYGLAAEIGLARWRRWNGSRRRS